jgi:hypothetical protein
VKHPARHAQAGAANPKLQIPKKFQNTNFNFVDLVIVI